MQYRNLGNSDLSVSRIGFGCWELGDQLYGHTVVDEAVSAIYKALDLGVTLFDTAPMYGQGRSETLLGKALKGHRDEVVIVSKVGMEIDGSLRLDSSRERIMGGMEESLQRLGTDYIDLFLIHWPDLSRPIEEAARLMEELRQSGKARYVGVSNFNATQMTQFAECAPITCHQMGYNIIDRRTGRERLPYCLENGIGAMAYGALCCGMLRGRYAPDHVFDETDWRSTQSPAGLEIFTRENMPVNVRVANELKELALSLGMTLPQMALNWVLRKPPIDAALVGIRKPEELEENVKALDFELSDETLAQIDEIAKGAIGADTELPTAP